MIEFGLGSHSAVRWLIGSDKAIYTKIVDFYMGNADADFVEVAGPPTQADIDHYYRDRGEAVPLPLVRLNLRLARNMLTGEQGVEVLCSEAELEEIARWERRALLDSFQQGVRQ